MDDFLRVGYRRWGEIYLAISTRIHASSLYWLLRAFADLQVFEEDEAGCFSLTPLGQCLLSSTPGSMRARAIFGGEALYSAWGDLHYSIRFEGTANATPPHQKSSVLTRYFAP